MKSLIIKKVLQIINSFQKLFIEYDNESNTLTITNDIPLNIIIKGQLNVSVEKDFEIESIGQFDIVTHGSKICLDSLNSQIYFNSRRTKYCFRQIDRFSNPNRQSIVDTGSVRHQYEQLSYEKLCDKIQELQNRLDKFDNKLLENT